jgi:endonuclease YncB( thermonuclease family)
VQLRLPIALAALLFGLAACGAGSNGEPAAAPRYSKAKLARALEAPETPAGLVLGEFDLAPRAVIDGDTIKVTGLDGSLRLLAIDSEETFKNEDYRRAADADFDAYLAELRGDRMRPAKAQTPMGEEAKRWAQEFFDGVRRVRLERDHPKEIRGRFNRHLTYVFLEKNGKWINYNVEHVRAGMSPYFTKYSYSRRFHDEFVAAEREARAARRGIWNPAAKANKDYDERKAWWDARADFIKEFEERAAGQEDYIVLTHWDSKQVLEKHIDQEVTVLGQVGSIRRGERGPTRVLLSRRMFDDLTVIFWDREVFEASGIEGHKGEFVAVQGIVQVYENKYRKRRELQVVVHTPSQVIRSRVPGIPLGVAAEPSKASLEERK